MNVKNVFFFSFLFFGVVRRTVGLERFFSSPAPKQNISKSVSERSTEPLERVAYTSHKLRRGLHLSPPVAVVCCAASYCCTNDVLSDLQR